MGVIRNVFDTFFFTHFSRTNVLFYIVFLYKLAYNNTRTNIRLRRVVEC